jgi:ketosteroid isomerase-like protein
VLPRFFRSFTSCTLISFAASCASTGTNTSSTPTPQAVVDELLATDRAFAAASARTDVITGLSAMFADDVAMPIPGNKFTISSAQAVEALRANPDNARSRAEWVPVRGGVSADGQHGFTYGYMTVYRADSSTVPIKYLSYWVKTPAGWRVAAYKRRPRPAGEVSLQLGAPALPARLVPAVGDASIVARHRESLDQAERAFSDEAQRIGLSAAFAKYGADDAMNMGGPDNASFVFGPAAISGSVGGGAASTSSPLKWWPDRVIVASSGDLGITIGMLYPNDPQPNGPTQIPFFTIWRRASQSDPWRYVAE